MTITLIPAPNQVDMSNAKINEPVISDFMRAFNRASKEKAQYTTTLELMARTATYLLQAILKDSEGKNLSMDEVENLPVPFLAELFAMFLPTLKDDFLPLFVLMSDTE